MAGIKTVYRTAQGNEIDLNKLINQNELTLAVGNKKVNARGDLIGPGGKILTRNEDIMNGINIPDQIRKQPEELAQPMEDVQQVSKTKTKNIKDMDPEGNE